MQKHSICIFTHLVIKIHILIVSVFYSIVFGDISIPHIYAKFNCSFNCFYARDSGLNFKIRKLMKGVPLCLLVYDKR